MSTPFTLASVATGLKGVIDAANAGYTVTVASGTLTVSRYAGDLAAFTALARAGAADPAMLGQIGCRERAVQAVQGVVRVCHGDQAQAGENVTQKAHGNLRRDGKINPFLQQCFEGSAEHRLFDIDAGRRASFGKTSEGGEHRLRRQKNLDGDADHGFPACRYRTRPLLEPMGLIEQYSRLSMQHLADRR